MAVHKDQHKQFQERVVHIARVAKVVKGGRRFSFSALVCVGDHKSKVGFGLGKANEVPDAIRKAADVSNKNLIDVPVTDAATIPFPVVGKSGSTRVVMYPAPPGKGVIAGSAARMIFDLCGIKDIVSKIHGSRNHHNVVRATFQGLAQLQSIEEYAALRGRQPAQVLQKTSTNHTTKAANQPQATTKNAKDAPTVATSTATAASSPAEQPAVAAAPDKASKTKAHKTLKGEGSTPPPAPKAPSKAKQVADPSTTIPAQPSPADSSTNGTESAEGTKKKTATQTTKQSS